MAFIDDDTAQVSAEAELIPEAQPTLAEVQIFTAKITQLIPVSMEQYRQEGTDLQLSMSAQRAVTKKADELFLAQVAPMAGLLNVAGLVAGAEVFNNLDPIVDLQAAIHVNGGSPSHLIFDPLGWAEVRKLKMEDTSNASLEGAGVTDAIPLLLGLPVLVNREMPAYSGVMIDRSAVVSAVGEVHVDVSTDRYFEYDSALLRVTWRIGQNVVRPDRCGTFTVAAPGS